MQNQHLIFVYGTLKRGCKNHNFLKMSNFFGETITKNAKYDMGSNGFFPMVVENGTYRIHGEVYCVENSTLTKLDMLECNGILYERKKINVEEINEPIWTYISLDSLPNSKKGIGIIDSYPLILSWTGYEK